MEVLKQRTFGREEYIRKGGKCWEISVESCKSIKDTGTKIQYCTWDSKSYTQKESQKSQKDTQKASLQLQLEIDLGTRCS
jgi:hypothetical protein